MKVPKSDSKYQSNLPSRCTKNPLAKTVEICDRCGWLNPCDTEKKSGAKTAPPLDVLWSEIQLHPWHYIGTIFKGGAAWTCSLRILALSSKVAPSYTTAPGWSHFGSTIFSVYASKSLLREILNFDSDKTQWYPSSNGEYTIPIM